MNVDSLSLFVLIGIFIAAAVAIWIAGIQLSKTTDTISKKFGFGEALGGMIILAVVTNLPEIAIVISASLQNKIEIAIGNILGGIAVQTVVLVVLDAFGLGRQNSLTYKAASLTLVLEGALVLAVLSLVVLDHQLPKSLIFLRMTPGGLLILIAWIVGIKFISKARKDLPWIANFKVDKQEDSKDKEDEKDDKNKPSIKKTFIVFIISTVITLAAGVALERTGNAMATHIGMQGVIFGATVLAVATSLPEISTGLAAVKMKDYEMAVSDIFGGNAFLPVLFLLATLLSGQPVLPQAQKSDIYLTGLAMVLTSVYIWGHMFRTRKQILCMGIDSFVVLVLYALGIVGLFAIAT